MANNPLKANRAEKRPTRELRDDLIEAVKQYEQLASETEYAPDEYYYLGIVSAYKKVLRYYLGEEV